MISGAKEPLPGDAVVIRCSDIMADEVGDSNSAVRGKGNQCNVQSTCVGYHRIAIIVITLSSA